MKKLLFVGLIFLLFFVMNCAGTNPAVMDNQFGDFSEQYVKAAVAQLDSEVQIVSVMLAEQDALGDVYIFLKTIVPGELASTFFILTKSDGQATEPKCTIMAKNKGWHLKSSFLGGLVYKNEENSMYQITKK